MIELRNGFEITHGCKTDPTDTHGRKSCHPPDEIISAPNGYVINDRKLDIDELVRRGECHYDTVPADWIEVLPEILYPQKLIVSASSRSPSANGTTGNIQIRVSGTFISISRLRELAKNYLSEKNEL